MHLASFSGVMVRKGITESGCIDRLRRSGARHVYLQRRVLPRVLITLASLSNLLADVLLLMLIAREHAMYFFNAECCLE